MTQPHSRALRIGRTSIQGAYYLCTAKTHQRLRFFADVRVGRLVVDELRRSDEAGFTDTWTFVVMPDHFHWLFELTGTRSLSLAMAAVKARSSRTIRAATARAGPIWQPGFHDHALRREETLVATARYVVLNPVRAGLVRSVRAYPLWDAKWL